MARRKKVDLVVITCYGQQEIMDRGLAIQKYLDCLINSEGAERDRYVNIYYQLVRGAKEAYDC